MYVWMNSPNYKNSKQPWINRNIKQLRRWKQRYYNKAKSSNSMFDWNRYKDIKKTMQRETRHAFNQYMYKTVHTPYENGKRKRFYKYIKSLRSDHTGIPSLEKMVNSIPQIKIKQRSWMITSVLSLHQIEIMRNCQALETLLSQAFLKLSCRPLE